MTENGKQKGTLSETLHKEATGRHLREPVAAPLED